MAKEVSYSIRLDETTREKMRGVDGMADKIRDFIEETVDSHERDNEGLDDYYDIVEEYGSVGAYCLFQLSVGSQFPDWANNYSANVDVNFKDNPRAEEFATRTRQEWNRISQKDSQQVEDVLTDSGYVRNFREKAYNRVAESVENEGAERWAYWTVVELARSLDESSELTRSTYRIKRKSIELTLSAGYGFDEVELEEMCNKLISLGGVANTTDTNAYYYHAITFPDYVIEGIQSGLEGLRREVRTQVTELCGTDSYLDDIRHLTSGETHLYQKDISENTDEEILSRLISDGAVVVQYHPSRSSTGSRTSLPSRREAVLVPEVRGIVSDAAYRQNST